MSEVSVSGTESAAPPVRISRMKQFLFAFVIFIVFLILLEVALRVLGIPAEVKDLRNDSGLVIGSARSQEYYMPGWQGYQAGARVQINSRGLRGKEFADEKSPGTIRILGFGDSFTFGRAVNNEEVFLVKLEQMLNADAEATYETINFGRERLNTAAELNLFRSQDVFKLKPDFLVLGFTVHNDAQEAKNRTVYRELRKTATLPLKIVGSQPFISMAGASRIAAVLKLGVEWAYGKELNNRYYNIIVSNYTDRSRSWETCRSSLEDFYQICREMNVRLLFVIFPVYPMEIDQTFREYPEELKRVHEKLASVFSGRDGVKVVDMLPDLAASGFTTRQTMVPIDRHPNARWHEMVARSLYEAIKVMEPGSAGSSNEASE